MKKYKWRNWEKVSKRLLNNEIGILPTSGVYGIFALATPNNVNKINLIKGAPLDKKNSIMFPSIEKVFEAMEIPESFESLVRENVPGLTTFILKPKQNWIDETGFDNLFEGVGVRVTTDYNLMKILEVTGPLINTSANFYGKETITKAGHADSHFSSISVSNSGNPDVKLEKTKISFILDGGNLGNTPSTIISLLNNEIEIIRSKEYNIGDKKK